MQVTTRRSCGIATMMKKIVCAIIVTAMLMSASVGAGSGFDSTDCDPQSYHRVRAGRARLISTIPCDLTKQSYCNIPGEAYPWNAMKRFVYENQGLVRRMYGDIRHIFVMQSELENEVDSDDFKHHADKYSKAFNSQHEKEQKQKKKSREMKLKKLPGEKKNFRSDTEPHFRPLHKSARPTRTPKPPTSEQQQQPTEVDTGKIVLIHKLLPQEAVVAYDKVDDGEKSTTNASTTTRITTTTSPVVTAAPLSTSSTEDSTNGNMSSSSSPSSSTETATTRINDSEVSEVIPLLRSDVSTTTSSATSPPTSTSATSSPAAVSFSTEESELEIEKFDENDAIAQESVQIEEAIEVFDDLRSVFSSDISRPNSTFRPTLSRVPAPVTTTTSTTEAQLFQDSIFSKDKEPAPVVNRRGVNACPVKEEVVAPFWGNNTRGEILALLNVYPYEQYINWEKCTNEHEQMMCRRGCKCEQQYRLHRLLAYNPLDACRGIFSDWFRFPSCCICKCYDMPFDFRVTSRSPRGADKLMDDEENDEDEDEIDDSENGGRNYEEDFDDRIDGTDINREENPLKQGVNLERPLA